MPPLDRVRLASFQAFFFTLAVLPGPVWAEEVDFDKDGVPDAEDDCPTDPGDKANGGCRAAPKPPPRPTTPPAPEKAEVRGDHIEIPRPLEFETGSARLTDDAPPLIEALATAIVRLPSGKVLLVRGHTDNRGNRAANLLLSRRRAEAVVKALITAGVPKERVRSEGLGPDEPIAENGSEEGRSKNRRVEFKITDGASKKK
jgi:OmpA-OmpF porin, OOP family